MALPGVEIQIQNGGVGGVVGTPDQTAGLIVSGIATGDLPLNTPTAIYSVNDARNLGIDEAFDTTNDVLAFQNISEFYAEAGAGKKLWIMTVAQTEDLADICDYDSANPRLKTLLDAAGGEIRIVAVQRSPQTGYTPAVTNGFDDDAFAAVAQMQTTLKTFEGQFKPAAGIIDGLAYTGTEGDLTDLKQSTDTNVAVNLLQTVSDASANEFESTSVGYVLGRMARISVNQNIGAVKDGPISTLTTGYLSNTDVSTISDGVLTTIFDKGYITPRTYVKKNGVYFAGDHTATSDTDDYKSLSRVRTINKAIELAYSAYINEVNSQIVLNADGTIPEGVAKNFELLVEDQINGAMTSAAEISAVSAFVDPTQNVLSSGTLTIEVAIVPTASVENIVVKLGFTQSL